MEFTKTISVLRSLKFPLGSEAECQQAMAKAFLQEGLKYTKEYRFDAQNRIDFFGEGVGIEVKIKGRAKSILAQCERYCAFEELKVLIVATNRALGLPYFLNDKPVYIINLGRSWL